MIGGFGGSHLGRVARPREIKGSQKEIVPDHLSFLLHPNLTHLGERCHFNEAWLRNVKGGEKRK